MSAVTERDRRSQRRRTKPIARWTQLLALAGLIGVSSGVASALLDWALHAGSPTLAGRFTHLGGAGVFQAEWGVLLLPLAGCLASGLIVQLLFREPFGHGTDLLTHAFHRRQGVLALRGPAVKAVAAAGVISCGGSAGPEGPVSALGAAIGSSIGGIFRVPPRERRILLVAGCAAGVGAIFRCPLGGALFAAGVLYSEPEFESDAIVPSFVASVLGYSTFMLIRGYEAPLLAGANALRFASPIELPAYAALGLLCGGVSIFFSSLLHLVQEKLRPAVPLPMWLLPALGGLATGALACVVPQVMDGQYLFVRNAVDGQLFAEHAGQSWWWWSALFAGVAIAKCAATALTVGMGASGGVLGMSVFIGGVVGAFVGALAEAILPGGISESLRQSLIPVGMAGVLAAGMRTPLAAIVMVAEMTGGYGLIVPLMLVCVSAYMVGRRWGLNPEQVRSAADSPAHAADGIIHFLESWRVGELMERNWTPVVAPEASLGEMVRMLEPGTRPVFAVVRDGSLMGLVSVPDLNRITRESGLSDALIASDIMTERLDTLAPDDDTYHALHEFGRTRHDVLPVVSRDGTDRWLGMLTRRRVHDTLRRRVGEHQELALRDHLGLRAIEHEGQIQELVRAVSPVDTDRIQRLMVPLDAVGKSIREADIRRRFGFQVIGIELPDGSMQFPPDLDLPLTSGHRLVASAQT